MLETVRRWEGDAAEVAGSVETLSDSELLELLQAVQTIRQSIAVLQTRAAREVTARGFELVATPSRGRC
jgi:hypothetical protein